MTQELFASCYVDECLGGIFVQELRKNGFTVRTAKEEGLVGAKDNDVLTTAICLKSVLITIDKRTFLDDSEAKSREHYGIIIITKQLDATNSAAAAREVIKLFLNTYAKDEWKNQVVKL